MAGEMKIKDVFGREWERIGYDLYRHDSLVWPKSHVLNPAIRWPRVEVLSNPNYKLCDQCVEGIKRAAGLTP